MQKKGTSLDFRAGSQVSFFHAWCSLKLYSDHLFFRNESNTTLLRLCLWQGCVDHCRLIHVSLSFIRSPKEGVTASGEQVVLAAYVVNERLGKGVNLQCYVLKSVRNLFFLAKGPNKRRLLRVNLCRCLGFVAYAVTERLHRKWHPQKIIVFIIKTKLFFKMT